jgi:hypothetical protein
MSSELIFDDGGKARRKPAQETADPQKEAGPLTTTHLESKPSPEMVARMQQTVGNAAVQRFLAQRSGSGPTELDDDTAGAINSQRGSGQQLDAGIAQKAGSVMGQDFSGVTVHTDSTADNLSRQIGAKAFTTGSDVFFQAGAYNPATSEGQHLISHELTHVVQQGASAPSLQGKMSVNDPNDQYEAEADSVADMVMSHQEEPVQMQEEEELQTQEDEEELQMQEDEEELQLQEDEEELQLQEDEEELQLQEDEEEIQTRRE